MTSTGADQQQLPQQPPQQHLPSADPPKGQQQNSHSRKSTAGSVNDRHFTLGFLGGGMMASALVRGLLKAEVLPPFCVSVSDPSKACLQSLAAEGVMTYDDNTHVIEHAQVLILAVKPDIIPAVLRQISPRITRHHLVVSIAAGITIAALQQGLPEGTKVVRVMPNTPCLVGQSAAAFALGSSATQEDQVIVKRIFSSVGIAVEVKEKDLNAVTGLSGSGPAYVYILIEALADGGVRAGLSRQVAMQLAAQTVKGAAQMVLQTGEHPEMNDAAGQLKDNVCSPGGTTIAGVEALEKGSFRASAMAAVVAATNRAKELSEPAPSASHHR